LCARTTRTPACMQATNRCKIASCDVRLYSRSEQSITSTPLANSPQSSALASLLARSAPNLKGETRIAVLLLLTNHAAQTSPCRSLRCSAQAAPRSR
jgi:hypothetical protein